MIVDSMSYEEVVAEFEYDWEHYFPYVIPKQLDDNKYRRFILKQTRDIPVYFKPIKLTSKRGNQYILQINSKGKSDFKKYGLLFILYMYFHRPEGIYVVLFCSESCNSFERKTYNFYIPHLFDRYRERELKDIHKPKLETIIDFFQNNSTTNPAPIDNNKYKNSVFCAVTNGVMLGSRYNNYIYEHRTFITFDMLKGDQIETSENLTSVLKAYIEKEQ